MASSDPDRSRSRKLTVWTKSGPIRINSSLVLRPKRRAPSVGACAFSSAPLPVSARPMRCSRRPAVCVRVVPTSSSAMWSPTAASRPSAFSKAWNGCQRLPVSYRGIVRHEFDLDAALLRRPSILLVDELAHSNLVGGSLRHDTPSAGRTSKSYSTPASASGRPSTFNILRVSTTWLRRLPACAKGKHCRTAFSMKPMTSS